MEPQCAECGKAVVGLRRGLCQACYSRWWRRNGANPRPCKECGRLAVHLPRGLCQTCYTRHYRKEKPEIVHEVDRRSRAKNADKVRQRKSRWQKANRKKGRASEKKYREANREKRRASFRRHYQNNKAYYLEKWRKYEARKQWHRNAPVDERAIYQRDRGICQLCKKRVVPGQESIDHIVPLSHGGTHEPANVQLAHLKCNVTRGNRGPAQIRLLG